MKKFHELYDRMIRGEIQLVFVDESHFHRDMDLGYTWGRVGKRVWRISDCPPLSDRINWYGAFDFSEGQCLIWNEGNCDKQHKAMFLERLKTWLPADGRRVVVIWDGAPWHRAKSVQNKADELGIELIPLPGYSPDLNPIEGLWKWMREDVTQLCCHSSLRELFDACKAFIDRVNRNPLAMIDRLWPRFELDPEAEKLLFSE
jgi:transposase